MAGKYKCLLCEKEFISESGVKYHINSMHAEVRQAEWKPSHPRLLEEGRKCWMLALFYFYLAHCREQDPRLKWRSICFSIAGLMHWSGEQLLCHVTCLVPSCCCSVQQFSISHAFSGSQIKSLRQ